VLEFERQHGLRTWTRNTAEETDEPAEAAIAARNPAANPTQISQKCETLADSQ
jgi:hypothetical protein